MMCIVLNIFIASRALPSYTQEASAILVYGVAA